jgi:hypothetical protein
MEAARQGLEPDYLIQRNVPVALTTTTWGYEDLVHESCRYVHDASTGQVNLIEKPASGRNNIAMYPHPRVRLTGYAIRSALSSPRARWA